MAVYDYCAPRLCDACFLPEGTAPFVTPSGDTKAKFNEHEMQIKNFIHTSRNIEAGLKS